MGGLFAVLSGMAFCIGAILFKVGQGRDLTPMQIIAIAGAVGTVVFAVPAMQAPLGEAPPIVFILAAVAGVSQYFLVTLLRLALKFGAMSAMWCAVSLMFVPVIFYSWLAWDQGLTVCKTVGACMAVACVITATEANRKSHQTHAHLHMTYRRAAAYLGLLVTIFLVNGVSAGTQFDLSQRMDAAGRKLLDQYGMIYYAAFYATIFITTATDLAIRSKLMPALRKGWWMGILTGVGSVVGMYIVGLASMAIGSITFALCGAAGILTTAIVGAVFFKEKRSLAWYATITLGTVAVIMGNI